MTIVTGPIVAGARTRRLGFVDSSDGSSFEA